MKLSKKQMFIDLLATPKTRAELKAETGIPTRTLTTNMLQLREEGLIHICGWHHNRAPIYKAGNGKDVKRKPTATNTERNQKWRKARKNDPLYRLDRLIATRRYEAKKRKPKPDPFLAQFAGIFKAAA